MKKGVAFIFLMLCFASCKNTWNEEDKEAFHVACMEDAKKWARSEAMAKAYCDCVFDKVEKKYPNENDALEHIEQISKDSSLYRCRDEAINKPYLTN